jgi:hypothetical protein
MLERNQRRGSAMRMKTVFAIALLGAIAGCSHAPRRMVNPPRASIQQLQVLPDGQWRLDVRLQNFSNVPTAFATVHAQLTVGGQDAGAIDLAPAMRIGPESADVVKASLRPALGGKLVVASALAAGQSQRYKLKGTIVTTEPKGSYPFEFESSLNPAPGLPGVMR